MNELEHKLAALRQRYTAKLGQKLQELEQIIKQIQHEPAERDSLLITGITLSHKLRGSAGTYGFEDVSLAMETIEDLLRQLQQGTELTPTTWEQLQTNLDQALQAHAQGT